MRTGLETRLQRQLRQTKPERWVSVRNPRQCCRAGLPRGAARTAATALPGLQVRAVRAIKVRQYLRPVCTELGLLSSNKRATMNRGPGAVSRSDPAVSLRHPMQGEPGIQFGRHADLVLRPSAAHHVHQGRKAAAVRESNACRLDAESNQKRQLNAPARAAIGWSGKERRRHGASPH